jgi:hypothetical protein
MCSGNDIKFDLEEQFNETLYRLFIIHKDLTGIELDEGELKIFTDDMFIEEFIEQLKYFSNFDKLKKIIINQKEQETD